MLPDALAFIAMRCLRSPSLSARGRTYFHIFVLIVGSSFLVKSLYGQFTSSAQSAVPATHVLTGTVVNAVTAEAVPFALVQAGEDAVLADQNGQFRFDGLTSTQFSLEAHKPGFFNDRELSNGSGPPLMITVADKPVAVSLRLTPEAVITGNVHTPDGDGIERLPIRARFRRVINGRSAWQTTSGQMTDEDGNFRIAGLTPGTYFVEAGPSFGGRPAVAAASTSKFEGFSKHYYPGVTDISAASPVRLAGGQRVSTNFTMKPSPAYRLAGFVAGALPNGGGLFLKDREGENAGVGVQFDRATGRFEAFPVPGGSYRVALNGQDGSGNTLFADVPINVDSDVLNLQITVQRAFNIPVAVHNEISRNGSGTAYGSRGGVVSGFGAGSTSTYVNLFLVSRTTDFQQYWPTRDGASPDAPMMLRGVKPGIYDVQVQPMGNGYVASLSSSGADLLREPLVIAEGSDPQPIEAVLRDDSASLDGSVRVDAGQQLATVLVFSEKNIASSLHTFAANASGEFHLQGLAPGDYDVLAFDRVDGIEYQNREALAAYLSHAAHVTLAAAQQGKVTVDLIHTQ
jgi:hypothetical protein